MIDPITVYAAAGVSWAVVGTYRVGTDLHKALAGESTVKPWMGPERAKKREASDASLRRAVADLDEACVPRALIGAVFAVLSFGIAAFHGAIWPYGVARMVWRRMRRSA